jgi:nitrite reductase (NADH) large subunit
MARASPRRVIVGNGAAALAAVDAIRSVDRDGPITMIADEPGPAYSKVLTPYLIDGRIRDAGIRTDAWYERAGVSMRFGDAAVAASEGRVRLRSGEAVPFDQLLIATGASAYLPDIPGVDSPGVFTLRTQTDARRIVHWLEGIEAGRRPRAVFVGGGLVCLLVVGAVAARGVDTTILVSSDRLLSTMIDRRASELVTERLRSRGVAVRTHADVARILSTGGRVAAVATSDGHMMDADIVVVAKGVRSNIATAREGGIAVSRGILVDTRMRTSAAEVYAAGDVAESWDFLTPGKRTICATWFEAVHQGRIAGLGMAGSDAASEGSLKMNVMTAGGLPVASVGLVEAAGPGCEEVVSSRMDGGMPVYRKIVLREGIVSGAVLVGDVSDAGVLASLIRRRAEPGKLGVIDLGRVLPFGHLIRPPLEPRTDLLHSATR